MQTKKQARIIAGEQNGSFITAFSPAHRQLKQELARRDTRWGGITPIKEKVRK